MSKGSRLMCAILLAAIPLIALAGPVEPYQAARFDALTGQGKPVVVAVHASWCPTCRVQAPIQRRLMASTLFKNYTMFIVNFDKDRAALQRFHVAMQSTMIVFRGTYEVGRSIGDTNEASLRALMLRASQPANTAAGS